MQTYSTGGPSPEKAQQFLKDGQIYGHPLSDKQKEFFANLAGTDLEGNLLDEETGEPVEELDPEEQEFKKGGSMKRIEIPEGPLYYMFNLGGQNGIFKGDVSIDNPKLAKDLSKFIRQVNIVKTGGEHIPPASDVNDVVAQKKNTFQQFLQTNTMNALADEEAKSIIGAHDLFKKYGGSMFAYGGEEYDQPIGPETPYEHALRMRQMKQPIPGQQTAISDQIPLSQTNEPSSYDWKANPFDQKTPTPPNQVSNTTMTGVQAPAVVPSTTQVMDNLTPNATRLDADVAKPNQRNNGINYTQSNTSSVPYGQLAAEGIITGMEGITSLLNAGEYKKQEELRRKRMNADAVFTPVTGSNNRGTYDVNSGAFRPDQMVPQQFKGNTFGQFGSPSSYKLGGEHEMDDEEIKQLIKQGYKIDYLD